MAGGLFKSSLLNQRHFWECVTNSVRGTQLSGDIHQERREERGEEVEVYRHVVQDWEGGRREGVRERESNRERQETDRTDRQRERDRRRGRGREIHTERTRDGTGPAPVPGAGCPHAVACGRIPPCRVAFRLRLDGAVCSKEACPCTPPSARRPGIDAAGSRRGARVPRPVWAGV